MAVLAQSDVLMEALKVRCHETGKHTSKVVNRADPTRVETFVGRFVVQSHQLESLGFEMTTENPQDEVGLLVEIVSSMYDELKVVACFNTMSCLPCGSKKLEFNHDDGTILCCDCGCRLPHEVFQQAIIQPLVSALLIECGQWVWVKNHEQIDRLILCILTAEVYREG